PVARTALELHRDQFSAGDLLRMLTTLAELEPQFRKSSQQQLLVEMLLVRFALFDRTMSIEEVLRGLSGGAQSTGGNQSPTRERPAQKPVATDRETRRAAMVGDASPRT